MDGGFIKLYRKITEWEWYLNQNTKDLFLHLLLTANYKDKKWQGITVKRGQRVCSYATLAEELRFSVKQIRVALNHLIATGEVAHKGASHFSVITVINYDDYQSNDDDEGKQKGKPEGSQGASQGQAKGNNIRKKESKESKEIKKYIERGEFLNVRISADEYQKLIDRIGKRETDELIEDLSCYMKSKKKTYADHYSTILAWWRKRHPDWKEKEEGANHDREPEIIAGITYY